AHSGRSPPLRGRIPSQAARRRDDAFGARRAFRRRPRAPQALADGVRFGGRAQAGQRGRNRGGKGYDAGARVLGEGGAHRTAVSFPREDPLLNFIIRLVPNGLALLIVLTLPVVLLTLGLFTLVINAITFYLVAHLGIGLTVDGFWSAFLGAL